MTTTADEPPYFPATAPAALADAGHGGGAPRPGAEAARRRGGRGDARAVRRPDAVHPLRRRDLARPRAGLAPVLRRGLRGPGQDRPRVPTPTRTGPRTMTATSQTSSGGRPTPSGTPCAAASSTARWWSRSRAWTARPPSAWCSGSTSCTAGTSPSRSALPGRRPSRPARPRSSSSRAWCCPEYRGEEGGFFGAEVAVARRRAGAGPPAGLRGETSGLDERFRHKDVT